MRYRANYEVDAWQFDPDERKPPAWLPRCSAIGTEWFFDYGNATFGVREGEWVVHFQEYGTFLEVFMTMTDAEFKARFKRIRPPGRPHGAKDSPSSLRSLGGKNPREL